MRRYEPLFLPFILVTGLLLAACGLAGGEQPTQATRPRETPATAALEPTITPVPPESPQPTAGELDLRFANVIEVDFEQRDDGQYRFDVTLYHDDDGEAPNFADAWQVEDLQGNLLGQRELLHSHGTQPFTRSQTITIPPNIDVVMVRGHDMTHGFGGQAMRVNLSTGETTPVQLKTDS